jgi:hypothetical protein
MTTLEAAETRTPPQQFADYLDRKVARVLAEVEQSEVWRMFSDPKTDARLVACTIKHVLLEVFSTGPHITEATFRAISRLPKNRPDLMQVMINHDLEEVDHGEMALRDFVKLGGDEKWARSRRITPQSFVLAATCRMIGEHEDPLAYLGYMYLLECLTPTITANAQRLLAAKGFPTSAQVFIDTHATEDIAHARVMRTLIERVVEEFPGSAEAIEYGFDCFAAVYPLPIWNAAAARAREEMAKMQQQQPR